ncbi:hypothetical protein [Streptococcus sp.]|nr:hypothetical protein [Streptococcus sp.]MDY3823909.1 hypothetical protein [Streptococcus sp.]
MFGKLVKYELKSIGKWYFILYLLTLLVSIVLGMMVTTVDSQNNYEIGQSTLSALLVLFIGRSFHWDNIFSYQSLL